MSFLFFINILIRKISRFYCCMYVWFGWMVSCVSLFNNHRSNIWTYPTTILCPLTIHDDDDDCYCCDLHLLFQSMMMIWRLMDDAQDDLTMEETRTCLDQLEMEMVMKILNFDYRHFWDSKETTVSWVWVPEIDIRLNRWEQMRQIVWDNFVDESYLQLKTKHENVKVWWREEGFTRKRWEKWLWREECWW